MISQNGGHANSAGNNIAKEIVNRSPRVLRTGEKYGVLAVLGLTGNSRFCFRSMCQYFWEGELEGETVGYTGR